MTAADLAVCFLELQRTDENFHSFYEDVVKSSKDITTPPCLRRYRCPPKRLNEASLTIAMNSLSLNFISDSSILKC